METFTPGDIVVLGKPIVMGPGPDTHTILAGTPGIVEGVSQRKVKVAFEDGTNKTTPAISCFPSRLLPDLSRFGSS